MSAMYPPAKRSNRTARGCGVVVAFAVLVFVAFMVSEYQKTKWDGDMIFVVELDPAIPSYFVIEPAGDVPPPEGLLTPVGGQSVLKRVLPPGLSAGDRLVCHVYQKYAFIVSDEKGASTRVSDCRPIPAG